MFPKKWEKFLNKNGKHKSIDDFRSSLSSKQLPTGVIPIVKAKIEVMLRRNEVESMSAEDIPSSGMWLHRKVSSLKTQEKLSIERLINNYMEVLKDNYKEPAVEHEPEPISDEHESKPDGLTDFTKPEDIIRTVGKTLKGVINKNFDYKTLKDHLEQLQNSCHASIYGLSKALNALIHLIITGGLDSDINTHDVFRFKDVDFSNDGIGETEKDHVYLSEQSLKSLCDEKTFSYNGFWNIMSHCIGEKFPNKNTDTDCTTPPYYDDRKSNDESPGVTDAENKDEHKEGTLIKRMCPARKLKSFANQFLYVDRQSSDNKDDDFVVSEDTIVLDNATINRDLTARETNALIAVVMMLCGSETIEGDVSPEYIKRQLYKDKQETIPQEALVLCSKVVNNLRRISLKKDAEASFINCYKMRYLRNVLLNFAGAKTKFKKGRFYPVIEEKRVSSVFVNYATLYTLFCKDYNIFNSEGDRFTSVHDIKETQDKQFVFKNFFDWCTVDRIMKEQKMTFGFSFYYFNQYNLQFVGLKKSINKDLQKTPIINQEQPCLVIDNSQIEKEIKQLNDAIKIQTKEYAALDKSIRVEEWNRMNLGRSFRAKKKSNHPWDTKLYKQLKEKRSDCDNIYSQLRKLNSSLKDLRYRMFALTKARHRQSLPISTNSFQIPDKMKADLKNNRLLIQGVDPGIVTTAAISCVKSSTLFESLNRFQMLENHEPCTIPISNQKGYEYDYTANKINQAVLSNTHRLQREKKKYDIEKNLDSLEKSV
ncbi:hypothetical protein INT47_002561 [Mucor saturninus]|uniref:Uncharacterized protein n=1 Tax=Mucor saturninus TaxID=64648 RepID=A0A8H7QJV1_9FUNG|nr:hypothetical protein INT47_002561 [Mucor saturninus]